MKTWASLALLFVLFVANALAQTATGTITGIVSDPSGSPIPGVRITLTDQATNQSRTQLTNDAGLYEFRSLPRGAYRLEAEKSGFKKESIAAITLQVAQSQRQDIALQLGAVSESVTVEASPGLLQTNDTNLSQVIDQRRVTELPINGRNFMQLTFLAPGVVTAGRASATERQANYGPAFSVGGQRDNTAVVLMDGIEISGMELNNYPLAIPSLDSVAEFRVQTANYSAEFGGNSGAIINVASRRGTNQLHGTLFDFLRNDKLDARNFFAPGVNPQKRNQFGFMLGGPVLIPHLYNGRDRTFWMFSYEGTRQRNAVSSTTLVPTAQERAGDFSGDAGALIVDPFTKVPIPNNIIPASRINSVGKGLLALYPLPNNPADPSRNYIGSPLRRLDVDIPTLRVDHRLTSKDNLFGRFTINQSHDEGTLQALTPAFPYNAVQPDHNVQVALGDTRVFSPTIVNETNLGLVRFHRDRESSDSFKRNWVSELGIKGIPTQPLTYGAPSVTPSGFGEVGFSTNNAFFTWITQSIQVVDNLSIVRGKHTFKLGETYQKKQLNSTQWGAPNGAYAFSGIFTAAPPAATTTRLNSLADALFGYPSSYSVQTGPYQQRFRYHNFAWYLQDDWRLTSTLTMNLGVRWEFFGKPIDLNNRIATFDLASGQQILPGQNGVPRNLVNNDFNNFSPRLGLAWRPRGSNRLTARVAYGMFYSPFVGNDFRQLGFQNPFAVLYSRIVRPPDPSHPLPVFTTDDPLANLGQLSLTTRTGVDRNFRDGYVQEWNVTIQELLTPNTLFEVAYRGSKSTRLPTGLNYNEPIPFPPQPPSFALNYPYPSLSGITMLESRGAATYEAAQVRLEKRYSNGFSLLAGYIFGKMLTDVDSSSVGVAIGAGAFGPPTIRNLRLNKGPSVFDRPQELNVSALYDLPFFKNQAGVLGRIAGGWEVAARPSFFSGAYLTPSQFGAQFTGPRPDLVGNPNLPHSQRTIDRWFNVSALVNPQPGSLGTAGKGIIQGSGVNRWDLTLAKNFRIVENHKLQFRAELFNAFNHPQFDDPVMTPANNPLAGKITSASDFGYNQTERVIQLALKYDF
ncbi:MAG TPA: TonB-dependent receptor [Bryobacteraceae bacterium]|nr:TonB-dependent receptor [Bryobacteraceae bacterium]